MRRHAFRSDKDLQHYEFELAPGSYDIKRPGIAPIPVRVKSGEYVAADLPIPYASDWNRRIRTHDCIRAAQLMSRLHPRPIDHPAAWPLTYERPGSGLIWVWRPGKNCHP